MPSFSEVRKKWNLKQTLQNVRDTRNFTVEKTGRFAGRFFQVALAVFCWYFLGSQDQKVVTSYGMNGLMSTMWFFAVLTPLVSSFLVVVYVSPWFSHGWTSRRILIVESTFDFLMTVGWLSGFITSLVIVKGQCVPPETGTSCINFNWAVSWFFFLTTAFLFNLGLDIWALYSGLCGRQDVEGEVLLDVRRTTRLNK